MTVCDCGKAMDYQDFKMVKGVKIVIWKCPDCGKTKEVS